MTRKKKTRKTGPLALSNKPKADLKRIATDPGKHKGKGRKPGSRFNVTTAKQRAGSALLDQSDPRFGSKTPVQLLNPNAEQPVTTSASFDYAAAQAELQALENDTKLQALLERIEEGDNLTAAEEAYVDTRTERFEQLAEQLGIALDDDEDNWEDDDE